VLQLVEPPVPLQLVVPQELVLQLVEPPVPLQLVVPQELVLQLVEPPLPLQLVVPHEFVLQLVEPPVPLQLVVPQELVEQLKVPADALGASTTKTTEVIVPATSDAPIRGILGKNKESVIPSIENFFIIFDLFLCMALKQSKY